MKALVLTRSEGPESAQMQDIETPTPSPGEVRVALRAASLNYRELWISRGMYPGMKLPSSLGCDGAGVVDAVGVDVDASMIGREVVLYPARNWGDNPNYPARDFALYGMPLPGTIAEYICVPVENVADKPRSLSFEEAACLPTAGLTAWRALTVKAHVATSERVLVTGIGGGVAVLALKFALAMGARVYVTSGSDDKLRQAEALGASGGVNYRAQKWGKALAAVTGGLDVVIDGAPTTSLPQYSRCLNMGARVVIYGSTGGGEAQFQAPDLFLRHASLLGTAMGSPEDFRQMLGFIERHGVQPVIDRRYPLDSAREALVSFDGEHGMGKTVITI